MILNDKKFTFVNCKLGGLKYLKKLLSIRNAKYVRQIANQEHILFMTLPFTFQVALIL